MDAASGCVPTFCRWLVPGDQLLGTAPESLGAIAVRAQYERGRDYRGIRNVCSGAYYLLEGTFVEHGRVFLRVGVVAGLILSVLQVFPTGDLHGKYMARQQPVTT